MAADVISPLIYSPSSQILCKSPIRIAYYEPGHYGSVSPKALGKIGEYNNSCPSFELLDIRRTNQQHVIDNNESEKKGKLILPQSKSPPCITLFHFNVQSVKEKWLEIAYDPIITCSDIICISETWIKLVINLYITWTVLKVILVQDLYYVEVAV